MTVHFRQTYNYDYGREIVIRTLLFMYQFYGFHHSRRTYQITFTGSCLISLKLTLGHLTMHNVGQKKKSAAELFTERVSET